MTPYYQDKWVTIYHGDCREILPQLDKVDLVLTDPPYGVNWHRNNMAYFEVSPIEGDTDCSLRDKVLGSLDCPMLVFGSWKVTKPQGTRQVLIWDTKGALGMGALDLPWKPCHQEIYVIGRGFMGHRSNDVLSFPPVRVIERKHPHEKPNALILHLLTKCPEGIVLDPFLGSGTTCFCAKKLNRYSIGIEIEEKYCEIAARRCSQEVMDFSNE